MLDRMIFLFYFILFECLDSKLTTTHMVGTFSVAAEKCPEKVCNMQTCSYVYLTLPLLVSLQDGARGGSSGEERRLQPAV